MDGAAIQLGTPVPVVSHAYAAEGVSEVLLSVNGQAYQRSKPNQTGSFGEARHDWSPQEEGEYVLQVKAFSASGAASQSASVRVRVIGKRTPTAAATPTPTFVTAPDLAIVSVEAIVEGYKGEVPFCNTRVSYRNAGTAAVPRGFTIQFHFNGTPRLANTVAGGLAPGASAQVVFVFQFEGMPYIGINLDSTNVIAESDEMNNAFANARICGGTPPATRVPTWTPTIAVPPPITWTPTRTATPTRTPTATRTPTGTPWPTPAVIFSADKTSLKQGECTMLRWDVDNATSVLLDGQSVNNSATRQVCPTQTTTYDLHVQATAGDVDRSVTINVARDTTPPPVPTPQVPANGLALACKSTQTLAWLPVVDPSGIAGYYVQLERRVTANTWQPVRTWGPVTDKQVLASVQCGVQYRWAVRALDGAGNYSNWSAWFTFTVNLE